MLIDIIMQHRYIRYMPKKPKTSTPSLHQQPVPARRDPEKIRQWQRAARQRRREAQEALLQTDPAAAAKVMTQVAMTVSVGCRTVLEKLAEAEGMSMSAVAEKLIMGSAKAKKARAALQEMFPEG